MKNGREFTYVSPPVDDATLDQIEQDLEFVFPKEIRAHYLAINGGSPKRSDLPVDDTIYVVNNF